jgi:hypothetical protein
MLVDGRYSGKVTTKLVDSDTRASIERALESLGRDEPDDWTDRTMAHLAARDPEPVRAARPEVIEAAERLRNHPLLGVPHCGRYVAFLALAPFSTGVLVIPGTRRKPLGERQGGAEDLFVTDRPGESTGLWPHMGRLFADPAVQPSYPRIPLFAGEPRSADVWDSLKRLTFTCPRCGTQRPVKNVTLLRYFFEAVLRGEDEVRLFPAESSRRRPRVARSGPRLNEAGAPFEFIPLDEEDAVLLDEVLPETGSGPVDSFVPDAVMAGVDATRAAAELGCSRLAVQLVHSAARSAALHLDEASWQKTNVDRLSTLDNTALQSAIGELRRLHLWPWASMAE